MKSRTQRIIFICGAVNAGKSTVGKLVAEKLGAAFIEGDDIRKIYYSETVEKARPKIVAAIAALVKTLAQQKESVVVAYPLWKEDFKPLQKHLRGVAGKKYYFTLNPTLEAAITNRGTRELEAWEVKFIKELYKRGVNCPPFATCIDNTECTAEETTRKILAML